MKVRFIKSPTCAPYLLGYNIGDEADLENAVAKDLIDQKIAVAVDTAQKPSERTEKAVSKEAEKAEKR